MGEITQFYCTIFKQGCTKGTPLRSIPDDIERLDSLLSKQWALKLSSTAVFRQEYECQTSPRGTLKGQCPSAWISWIFKFSIHELKYLDPQRALESKCNTLQDECSNNGNDYWDSNAKIYKLLMLHKSSMGPSGHLLFPNTLEYTWLYSVIQTTGIISRPWVKTSGTGNTEKVRNEYKCFIIGESSATHIWWKILNIF